MWQLVADNRKREARGEALFFFAYANQPNDARVVAIVADDR